MQDTLPNLSVEGPPAAVPRSAALRTILNTNRIKPITTLLALIALAIALYAAGQSLSPAEIWSYVRGARLEWIAVAAVLLPLASLVRIARSVRLIGWEAPLPVRTCAQAVTGGQIINWLSPIRAGDVWRVWHIGRAGRNSLLWTASSVILEKGMDSLMLAIFAVVLLFSPLPEGIPVPVVRLLTTILICVLLFSAVSALGSSGLRRRIAALVPGLNGWFDRAAAAGVLPEHLNLARRPVHWMEIFAYSATIWAVGLLVNIALAEALGIRVGLITHVLLLLTLQTTTILAPVPGNVGVFPLIALSVLGAVGVDADQAVAFGSLLYVLAYGMLLVVGGLVFASSWQFGHPATPRENHGSSH